MNASVALGTAGVTLALIPWGFNPFGPGKLACTLAAALFGVLGLALSPPARARLLATLSGWAARAALAAVAFFALSLLTAVDLRTALLGRYPGYVGLFAVAGWVAIACAAAGLGGAEARTCAGRSLIVAVIVVALYAAVQRLGLDPMTFREGIDLDRVRSTLGNASDLGALLALALPLLADRALTETGAWRAGAWTSLACAGMTLAWTGSRGGMIAAVFALIVWFALSRKASPTVWTAAIPAVVVAGALAVGLLTTPASAGRIAGSPMAETTASGRVAIWNSTLPMIAERPYLGFGPASYGLIHPRFASQDEVDSLGRAQSLDDPHNVVLAVATSSGVPTALALVVAFAAVMAVAWKRGVAVAWAAGGIAGLAVALQVHMTSLAPAAAGAVLVGAIVARESTSGTTEPVRTRPSYTLGVLGVLFALLTAGALAVVAADAHVRSGFAAAETGEWPRASEQFASARSLAPWAPEFAWAEGRAATDALTAGATDALPAGVAAFRTAESRMPGDSRVPRDLGDLLIVGAVTGGSPTLWTDALSAYERALALASTDPRAWLGKGVAEAGAGDLASAVRDIGRATELAPRFADAWENLAAVYDARGDSAAAAAARAKAAAARE